MDPLPGRPLPARPISEVVRAWLQWFGVIRLLVCTLAIGAVGAGAFWLLRAPPVPLENSLPLANRSATSTTAVASTDVSVPSGPPAEPSATSGPDASVPALVVVDVAGAIVVPGVYELPVGARVHEAIAAAGGLAGDADTGAINLAAVLRDGDRLYVPHIGVPVPSVVQPVGGSAPQVTLSAEVSGPVDLNRATVEQLDALPGVGPATAQAIVDHREQIGPYASIDDLLDVHGIGPAKLEAMRDLVVV